MLSLWMLCVFIKLQQFYPIYSDIQPDSNPIVALMRLLTVSFLDRNSLSLSHPFLRFEMANIQAEVDSRWKAIASSAIFHENTKEEEKKCERQTNAQRININLSFSWKIQIKITIQQSQCEHEAMALILNSRDRSDQ